MGLFDRTLGSLRSGKAENVAMAMITPSGVAALPNLRYDTYVREGYQKNPLVFACVEEWTTDIAEPELRVYTAGKDGPEAVDGHPAAALAKQPNPFTSGDDFYAGIELYKRIAGNVYEYKVRSGSQKAVEKWLLRPDRVTIVPDRAKHILKYVYRIGAETFDLDPKDVTHHRTRNPYDDFYGMPPMMAGSGSIDIANFMRDMVKGFLSNSGVPAGILQVAGKLSDQEKALVRQRFRGDFGGGNAGNIIVSDGASEAPKYVPLSMPLGTRGLIVPELAEMDDAEICMIFRVPLSLAGARLSYVHSTLGQAGREADRRFFTEQELCPEWKSIASTQTMGDRGDLLGDGEFYEFDLSTVRSLNEDQNALHMRVRGNLTGIVQSIQEARLDIGKPRDPAPDDIFLVPISMVPTTWARLVKDAAEEPPAPVAPQIAPNGAETPATALTTPARDNLPPPQKRLASGPQVVVVNVQPGEVRKVFEYDEDDRMIGVREITGD